MSNNLPHQSATWAVGHVKKIIAHAINLARLCSFPNIEEFVSHLSNLCSKSSRFLDDFIWNPNCSVIFVGLVKYTWTFTRLYIIVLRQSSNWGVQNSNLHAMCVAKLLHIGALFGYSVDHPEGSFHTFSSDDNIVLYPRSHPMLPVAHWMYQICVRTRQKKTSGKNPKIVRSLVLFSICAFRSTFGVVATAIRQAFVLSELFWLL